MVIVQCDIFLDTLHYINDILEGNFGHNIFVGIKEGN
jgi:hypothetical protein